MAMLKYVYYAVLAATALYLYSWIDFVLRRRKSKASQCPPLNGGPFGLKFLYQMVQLSTTFKNFESFRDRANDYGATCGVWLLGRFVITTVDPENIKALLATQFTDFGKGEAFINRWEQFLGAGIFNADGETWSHARAMMRPQFLKERIADLDNFEDKMQLVFKLIKSGEVTDIMDVWFKFTLDSATEHLFGHCSNSLTATEEENSFANVFAAVQELQTKRDRHGPVWRLPFWREEDRALELAIQRMNDYVNKYVQLALSEKVDEDDESLLATLVRENRDPKFLRDSLVSALLAGRDTTAATLSWLIKELAKDPGLYKDLRSEILGVIGLDDIPTYSQLKNFKLLQAVINETLRLYPIVPMNARTAFKDTTLPRGGGKDGSSPIFVPAGTNVVYCPLVMQRRQQLTPSAELWYPRRWVEAVDGGKKYTPDHWTYIPFNGGPRICLGQNFALTEIAYAMTRVLQRFSRLESCDEPLVGDDFGYRYDILLTPRYGVKARFTI